MWFCEEVTHHVTGGTILNVGGSATNVVSDEVVMDLNVMSLLPSGLSPISHKEHGTLVVLKHHVIGHVTTLHLQERPYPQHEGHCIVYPN